MANSTAPSSTTAAKSLKWFHIAALATCTLVVIQALLAGGIFSNIMWMRTAHGDLGYLTFVVAAVTAIVAFMWARPNHKMGVFGHAVMLPVLCAIQLSLGPIGQEWSKWTHVVVGIITLAASIALVPIVQKYRRQQG